MRRRIGLQFTVTVGVVTVGVMLAFSAVLLHNQERQLLQAKIVSANQLSETIKKSTRQDMMANRLDNVYLIIRTIGEQEGIEKVRILEKTGEIIYSTREREIGTKLDMKAEACYGCHASDEPISRLDIPQRTRVYNSPEGRPLLGIINPIYNEPGCSTSACHYHPPEKSVLGVLDITMSLEDVHRELAATRNGTIGLVVAAFLAASLIIYFFVQSRILIPVQRLLGGMRRVSAGDLDVTIETNQADEIGRLTKSFNEMTQRLAEAQMQISQSDKLASVGRLAAGIAHEINNPLTGVLTYASFLLKRAEDNPEMKSDLEVIVRETKRCRQIVRGLLDFARQSAFTKSEIDLNAVVMRALDVLGNQLNLRGIKIRKHFDGKIPNIFADGNQIQQVVMNLLLNASDAVGEGGEIRVETRSIKVPPFGNAQIRKAFCPEGCSLVDESVKIRNMPAVSVEFRDDKGKGVIHLDPVYGSLNHVFSRVVKPDMIIGVSCPKCKASLVRETRKCPRCDAPLFAVGAGSDGEIVWCTRRGCHYQRWEAVEALGERKYAEIVVKDNGVGMSPETLALIFEPFFSTKGTKGTGLGLSVSWGIIRNHGGSIAVESEPGKGSTFSVRIPVEFREGDAL
ncbi:MAG: HAMP domain-containing protein [bacterium]